MHGDADDVIPFALGRALFDRIAAPKQFVVVRGGDHNDVTPPDAVAYWAAVDAFVDRLSSSAYLRTRASQANPRHP